MLKFSFWDPGKQGIKSYLACLHHRKEQAILGAFLGMERPSWADDRAGGFWPSHWEHNSSALPCKKCHQPGPSASEGALPDQAECKGSMNQQGTTVAIQPCHLTGGETEAYKGRGVICLESHTVSRNQLPSSEPAPFCQRLSCIRKGRCDRTVSCGFPEKR